MNIFYAIGWFFFGYFVVGSLAAIFIPIKMATTFGVLAGFAGILFFWKYLA